MSTASKASETLVLFTENFPYLPGEQFLEEELPYLARSFERIIIIPRRAFGKPRPIPDNVGVNRGLVNNKNWAISGISGKYLYFEIIAEWRNLLNIRGAKRFFDFLITAHRVKILISDLNLDPRYTLYYSYWMAHCAVGVALARKSDPKIRFISRAHGWDIYEDRHSPRYLPFRKLLFQNIDNIFTVSDHGRLYLVQKIGDASKYVDVCRLGVSPCITTSKKSNDGVLRIATCSSIIHVKRIDRLVSALIILAKISPDLRIVWTHLGDGPLRSQIENAALDFTDNVEYSLSGALKHDDVLRFYRENPVDVFVNTSNSEGVPVSIMEAQAHGIPVVAPRVGGVPEIVNSNNGKLLENGFDDYDLAYALLEFASTDSVIVSKRDASINNWKSKFDSRENYSRFAGRLKMYLSGENS